jgi:hypothetical protein
MSHINYLTVLLVVMVGSALCRGDSFAYIDWIGSGIDAWLTGGPTWYYDPVAGLIPWPDIFEIYPDAEFATYFTTPFLHPNSDVGGSIIMTGDGVFEPTFLHLGVWAGDALAGSGDYVLFQGTVLDPIPGSYGTIEFVYDTLLEPAHYCTFVIPEPASGVLLALGAWSLLRRR